MPKQQSLYCWNEEIAVYKHFSELSGTDCASSMFCTLRNAENLVTGATSKFTMNLGNVL